MTQLAEPGFLRTTASCFDTYDGAHILTLCKILCVFKHALSMYMHKYLFRVILLSDIRLGAFLYDLPL